MYLHDLLFLRNPLISLHWRAATARTFGRVERLSPTRQQCNKQQAATSSSPCRRCTQHKPPAVPRKPVLSGSRQLQPSGSGIVDDIVASSSSKKINQNRNGDKNLPTAKSPNVIRQPHQQNQRSEVSKKKKEQLDKAHNVRQHKVRSQNVGSRTEKTDNENSDLEDDVFEDWLMFTILEH